MNKWAWFGKKTQKMAIFVELLAIRVSLDSEGSSYREHDPSVEWLSGEHYHILWNEERSPGVVTKCGHKAGCPVITRRNSTEAKEIILKGLEMVILEFSLQLMLLPHSLDIPEAGCSKSSTKGHGVLHFVILGEQVELGGPGFAFYFYQNREEY